MEGHTHDQIVALVRRGRTLAAEAKTIAEELKTIGEKIEGLVPVGWELMIDGVPAARRKPNRQFSKLIAMQHLSPDEKKACLASGYDDKKIRAMVEAKGKLEECMEENPSGKAQLRLIP
jgi:hypothetical protein